MTTRLRTLITSSDAALRNQPLEAACHGATSNWLLHECGDLEDFRQSCPR